MKRTFAILLLLGALAIAVLQKNPTRTTASARYGASQLPLGEYTIQESWTEGVDPQNPSDQIKVVYLCKDLAGNLVEVAGYYPATLAYKAGDKIVIKKQREWIVEIKK